MVVTPFTRRRPKIITIPEKDVKCLNKSVIVRDTDKNVINQTLTIILPSTDRMDADKILEIGEVVAKGPNVCNDIQVGDTVLYRRIAAYYLPKGIDEPNLWMVDQFAIVAKY